MIIVFVAEGEYYAGVGAIILFVSFNPPSDKYKGLSINQIIL